MGTLIGHNIKYTDLISGNNAAPKCDVSEALAACCLPLQIEIGDSARGGN
jgi:hypothetical protein